MRFRLSFSFVLVILAGLSGPAIHSLPVQSARLEFAQVGDPRAVLPPAVRLQRTRTWTWFTNPQKLRGHVACRLKSRGVRRNIYLAAHVTYRRLFLRRGRWACRLRNPGGRRYYGRFRFAVAKRPQTVRLHRRCR